MPFMQLAQLALSDNAIYAACTIGIVRQCQICSYQPGITSGFSQNSHTFGIVRQCHLCSLHNWHCLTMPNMLIPAWYYKWVFAEVAHIWHCQTMPNVCEFCENPLVIPGWYEHIWHCQTMPIMQAA